MPIERAPDLRSQVYEILGHQLRSGVFAPTARLTENALAESLGVSRTPVREAMAMLVREGLLEQVSRGFRLTRISRAQLDHLTQVRRHVEPFAMRLVVTNSPPEDRRALAELIRHEVRSHVDDNSFILAHERIRGAILARTGNPILNDTLRQFDNFLTVIRIATLSRQSWRTHSGQGQLLKADLIEEGDPDKVEDCQRLLMDLTHQAFSEFLSESEADLPG